MASTQGFEPGQQWFEGGGGGGGVANPLLSIMGCDCPEADLGFLIGGWGVKSKCIWDKKWSTQRPRIPPRFLIELSAKRDLFLIKRIFKKKWFDF